MNVGFSNPIAGGNGQLVRNQLQSDNFIAGVQGWRIQKSGNAEFNNAVFRGQIAIGTAPAAHSFLNPGNGDIMECFDANANLIAQIIASGTYIDYLFTGGVATQHMRYQSTGMVGLSDGDSSLFALQFDPTTTALPTRAQASFIVANNAGTHVGELKIISGSDDGTFLPTAMGIERGIPGSLMQSDQTSTDNLVHSGDFSGTTTAGGVVTVTHGASFTPKKVKIQVHDTGATPGFGTTDVLEATLTSTTFQVYCVNFNGTTRASAAVKFYYWCYG